MSRLNQACSGDMLMWGPRVTQYHGGGELEAVGPLWDRFVAGHGLESRRGDAKVLGMVGTDQPRADRQFSGQRCRTRDLSGRPQPLPGPNRAGGYGMADIWVSQRAS